MNLRSSVGIFVAALVMVLPVSASADGYGSVDAGGDLTTCRTSDPWTICFPDDANVDFCTPYPWDPSIGNLLMSAMANLDAQTDAYDTYASVCGPHTDIGAHLNSSPEKA